ncbi:hypothetical protein NPIL_503051 [Nephila pilipes]|uniref:Uncharacterized protein n=1 Tax=Nephila pilipes TaxID=299642 RepID=A0A8X6P1X6_NEPPI|nr:hypothetical protein NPIL_503051 [Nephila pilipes]
MSSPRYPSIDRPSVSGNVRGHRNTWTCTFCMLSGRNHNSPHENDQPSFSRRSKRSVWFNYEQPGCRKIVDDSERESGGVSSCS